MMPRTDFADVVQGASVRLQNRLVFTDQSLLTQADVNNWTVKVFDASTGRIVKILEDQETDATDNFYDTLQTGSGWSRDATGFNFQYVLAGDEFKAEGGKQYRIEFDARTDDESLKWVWVLRVQPWMGRT